MNKNYWFISIGFIFSIFGVADGKMIPWMVGLGIAFFLCGLTDELENIKKKS